MYESNGARGGNFAIQNDTTERQKEKDNRNCEDELMNLAKLFFNLEAEVEAERFPLQLPL